MDAGTLVPDEAMFPLISKSLADPNCRRVVFDGFPRTVAQAKKLEDLLKEKGKKLIAVIYLDIPDAKLIERSTGTRVHKASGRTYNIVTHPPKKPNKDDQTGEPLIQPEECKEEAVKKKLATFHQDADPMIKYYEDQKLLYKIDAAQDLDKVTADTDKQVSTLMDAYKADKKAAKEKSKKDEAEAKPAEEAPKAA